MVTVREVWGTSADCSDAKEDKHTIDDVGSPGLFGNEVDRIQVAIDQLHVWVVGGDQFTLGAVANQCCDFPIRMSFFDDIQGITANIAGDASTPSCQRRRC